MPPGKRLRIALAACGWIKTLRTCIEHARFASKPRDGGNWAKNNTPTQNRFLPVGIFGWLAKRHAMRAGGVSWRHCIGLTLISRCPNRIEHNGAIAATSAAWLLIELGKEMPLMNVVLTLILVGGNPPQFEGMQKYNFLDKMHEKIPNKYKQIH